MWVKTALMVTLAIAAVSGQSFENPFIPIAPLAVLHSGEGRIVQQSNRRPVAFRDRTSTNPCSPSPCGPNTRCDTNSRGIALCKCLDDFVPDGNTINGCKYQCVSDGECPDDYRCSRNKCVRVCTPGACGQNADCDARNHRAVCSCPNGFNGNAELRCTRNEPVIRVAPQVHVDPCDPSPCGTDADCRVRGDRPVCSCPRGFEGDPLSRCIRGQCIVSNDCPSHQVCQQLRCVDPCIGICGSGADCNTRNHQPVCSCPNGYTGDPFTRCRRFDPRELCDPSPCGSNTNCKVRNNRAVCSCFENYIGDPLTGCRAECLNHRDCPLNMACEDNRCINPCRLGACGENAYCDVENSIAVCSCPQFYKGSPHTSCYAECTAHDDCPNHQACFQLECVDPCEGACGTGADCKVENHKPICSCPKGYTGHPFESCRPFTREDLCNPNPCGTSADCTPGFDREGKDRPVCTCPRGYIGNPLISCQRGDCESHDACPDHQACYAYQCQNPCYTDVGSVCGDNADCNVKRHQPVCSCPPGYDGDPLTSCRVRTRTRFTVGRAK